MNQIEGTCWKGCESMSLDARGSVGGLVFGNPHEVVFEDWMASDQILTRRFKYVVIEDFIFLSVVYNPPGTRDKKVFCNHCRS